MKILMLFPIIASNFSFPTKETSVLPFESIDISPFYTNKESKVVVTTKSNFLSFRLFIQNDKHMNVAVLVKEITAPGTYTYTYSNEYSRSKNRVFVRYSTDGQNYADTVHADRNVGRATYHNIENNEGYSSKSSVLQIRSDMTYVERPISYSFYGFEGIYVPPYYQRIRLTDFRILLNSSDKTFFDCTPSLVIKNYRGSYNGIDGADEYVTFPLKLVNRADGFSFALVNDYFVNVKTLEMYSKRQNITNAKTKNIYLPVNSIRDADKYECYFQLSEFGLDKDIVIHTFEIRCDKNIFGDCSNSKYCITREEL